MQTHIYVVHPARSVHFDFGNLFDSFFLELDAEKAS